MNQVSKNGVTCSTDGGAYSYSSVAKCTFQKFPWQFLVISSLLWH